MQNPGHWSRWTGMWAAERSGMITFLYFLFLRRSNLYFNEWLTLCSLLLLMLWLRLYPDFATFMLSTWTPLMCPTWIDSSSSGQLRKTNLCKLWTSFFFNVICEAIRYVILTCVRCVDQAKRYRSAQGGRCSWFHQQPHTWMLCSPVSF